MSLKAQNRTIATMQGLAEEPFKVGPHGHVQLLDFMGDDHTIAAAARQSYGQQFQDVDDMADRRLLRFLMEHRHTSPFEMAEVQFHVKCPVDVARQWIRHRTANVNEFSGRYSEMPEEFRVVSEGNDVAKRAFACYQNLLDAGVKKEEARWVLPLGTYTQFTWKIDLHNLFHFLHLRLHESAQSSIREFAEQIDDIVMRWVPLSYGAWVEYVRDAKTLSASQVTALNDIIGPDAMQALGLIIRDSATPSPVYDALNSVAKIVHSLGVDRHKYD